MFNGKSLLAVIPARGGSKRLPGKNTRLLVGKPLINWTIESALSCKYIDQVVVSTDCAEISAVAKKNGASVPFLRPKFLSGDESSSIDVVLHALDYLSKKGEAFDYVVLLQPTSPLRSSEHISAAIKLLISKSGDAVISVCETEHSPLWMNTLGEGDSMDTFLASSIKNKRSQNLQIFYRLNGAIYLVDIKRLKEENTFFLSDNIYAYKMSRESSIDIDEKLDFHLAEVIVQNA
jgi:CMP-N-acetylneuraminic acid synthetase